MNDAKPSRPARVSSACVYIGIACVLALGYCVSLMQSWNSLAMQEMIGDVLAEEPLSSSGVSVQQVVDVMWWGVLLLGVACGVGLVLTVYTWRGHRQSRLLLTILCGVVGLGVVLVPVAQLVGVVLAAFCAVSAFSLWSPEARAWFDALDGRRPRVAPAAPVAPASSFGSRPAPPPVAPQQPLPPSVWAQPPATQGAAAQRRPQSVVAAGIVTLVGAGLVGAFAAVTLVTLLLARGEYERALAEQQVVVDLAERLSTDIATITGWFLVGSAVLFALSLLAGVAGLALLATRRSGRVPLLVLSIVTVALGMALFPVGVPWVGAAIAVVVLLTRPSARAWFSRS